MVRTRVKMRSLLVSTHVLRPIHRLSAMQDQARLPELLVHFTKNTLFLSSQEYPLPPKNPPFPKKNEKLARM